jgi:hypothetical protein
VIPSIQYIKENQMLRKVLRLVLGISTVSLLLLWVFACQPVASLAETEASQVETRCGWLSNPTPGNIWLDDRDGNWTISVQGGYSLDQEWPWPAFKKGQWIVTNAGDHGYGCACLQLRVDKESSHVLEIKSARPRPLAACRKEPALKKIERTFK